MHSLLYTAAAIAITAIITWLTRALPHLMFGTRRDLPMMVGYLGSVLPAAIMVVLVVYCLRNIDFSAFPWGLAELISVAVVAVLQVWKKHTFVSILAGTACYMILIRTVFPG